MTGIGSGAGPLGLIAGNGRFPFLVAESARRQIEKLVTATRQTRRAA